jgi:hypothetical protein
MVQKRRNGATATYNCWTFQRVVLHVDEGRAELQFVCVSMFDTRISVQLYQLWLPFTVVATRRSTAGRDSTEIPEQSGSKSDASHSKPINN